MPDLLFATIILGGAVGVSLGLIYLYDWLTNKGWLP